MRRLLILFALLAAVLPAPTFAQDIPRAAQTYRRDLVRNAHLVVGLDAPVATFAAQIHQESGWRPDARSPYAHGLAQFTPDTAEWIGGLDPALAGGDTGNPVWALRALVRYDAWLLARVPGASNAAPCTRMALALRAYNGGLGYVQREARSGKPCEAFRSLANCRENRDYPQRILTRLEPIYVRAGWGLGSCA
jgi:soluble lytic murein transglycosylase-like protein